MKIIESKDGERLAEVILSGQKVDKTTFYSDPNSSFQFGFVAHKKGYQEEAHFHKKIEVVSTFHHRDILPQRYLGAKKMPTQSANVDTAIL